MAALPEFVQVGDRIINVKAAACVSRLAKGGTEILFMGIGPGDWVQWIADPEGEALWDWWRCREGVYKLC